LELKKPTYRLIMVLVVKFNKW